MTDGAEKTRREAAAKDRETRLKAALKANLARRKAQAQARAPETRKTEER